MLALPNNLVGYVPLTAISDKLNERIEKLLKEEQQGNDDSHGEDSFEDVALKDMFHVGQYLRACVTSTSGDTEPGEVLKSRRRIELSIHPNRVNRGVVKSNLVTNCMIQASVISNEDHGLVMDMGLDERNIKGFLPKSELGKDVEHAKVQEGAVFMCLVSGLNPDGRIVKLSADQQKAGNLKKGNTLAEAPTIDVFLPGTAVDVLITELSINTIVGKILGLVDATADIIHSGAAQRGADLTEKYKTGQKVKARILFTCEDADPKRVGVSLLDHVLSLSHRMSGKPKERKNPLDVLSISSLVEEAKVSKVDPMLGAFFDLGLRDVVGFAHISRLAEGRIDTPSETFGPFQLASKHRARVIGYSSMDGVFQLSLEEKVLAQPFLRIEDIKVGQIVKGRIHKLFADKSGSTALLVSLSEGIMGLVSEVHLADVHLQHPERKFREGASVTARVLSTDPGKRQVRLTLKKSLVNSDVEPWNDYSRITQDATGPGTLVDIKPTGALVQFYGNVKAWLPAAEMSEAFIEDATRHFTKGQVVNVRMISLEQGEGKMLVSCKDPDAVDADKESRFKSLTSGDVVKGTVVEKSLDSATIDLGHGVKGVLRIGHLTDGSEKKGKSTMARVRVGGTLDDLVVLDKHQKSRTLTLSSKPSLRKAAQAGTLIKAFDDVKAGQTVSGFVRGIMPDKVFVEFGGGISGAVFKSQLTEEMTLSPNFGLRKDQSITARVTHVDPGKRLFWLSMRPDTKDSTAKAKSYDSAAEAAVNPVDANIKSTADLKFGTTIDVLIRSRKSTQVNVRLADNLQGRIHVAEMFDNWDDIKDKKNPLSQFETGAIIKTKVIGMHNARNYRFLPISHREGTHQIYELTAKDNIRSESDMLTLDKITQGASFLAFVNNIAERYVWASISANIHGRIDLFDLTDDLSLLGDVEENFPVGSALKVRVKAVDVASGRLSLTAASTLSARSLTLKDLKEGLVLPARVTKLHDAHIIAQINENVAGPVYLEQLADDFDKAKPSEFKVGEIIRVCVTEIDVPNKRLGLSARPSKVLSSSLPIKDPEVKDNSQLKVGQVVRGFVKKIADNALFVRLGSHVDAMVRVSHLSDAYIKDWKSEFQVDKLVTGKVIANQADMRNPQMSLKKSVVEGDYVKPLGFRDIEIGQIVTAKVRHVENYGVFLVIDNSENVSGLCHVSEMADNRIEKGTVKELYKEGDAVKAKVLRIDAKQRKITFGLKYSYIKGDEDGEDDEEIDDALDASVQESEDTNVEIHADQDEEMRSVKSVEDDGDAIAQEATQTGSDDVDVADGPKAPAAGLSTSGFDWTGATLDFEDREAASDDEGEDAGKKKKKHKKATIKEDRTGDLDAYGPQSVADYERLLLGQPNSAELWVRYMVFQRELNEIEKARQIARRALATMNPREEKERLDVWTALLHLENEHGSDDLIEETFKEACQYNDSREMHERMIKIYISSGKLDVGPPSTSQAG